MNVDKINFVHDLKSFVAGHSSEALKRKVEQGAGKLRFKLNGHEVEIIVKEDFFLTALENFNK